MEYKVRGFTFGIAPKVTKVLGLQKLKSRAIFLKSVNSLRSNNTDFLTEYRPAFLLRNAFSGKGRRVTGVTRVAGDHLMRAQFL